MRFYFYFFSDTKNSVGLVGCIEEVSHNAIAVYWNPLESSAKVKIAFKFIEIPFIQGNYRYFLAKYEERKKGHMHACARESTHFNGEIQNQEKDEEEETC